MYGEHTRHEQVRRQTGRPIRARVLLVHENCTDLGKNRAILQQLGCQVFACTTYFDGLRSLEVEHWDLIVVSQGSPAFEGRSVLERTMEINRDIPVLILTRWHDMPSYVQAMHLGAVDYLEEPVSLSEMGWVLETHLRRPRSRDAQQVKIDRDVEACAAVPGLAFRTLTKPDLQQNSTRAVD